MASVGGDINADGSGRGVESTEQFVGGGIDLGDPAAIALTDVQALAVRREDAAFGARAGGNQSNFARAEMNGGDVGRATV